MTGNGASDLNPLERFSDRVEDYVRYRPSYPGSLIRFLEIKAGLGNGSAVADVGSGTGIFTRLLLGTDARVFAVEPNDAMRTAAEQELRGRPGFTSVKGTAEATGLEPRSVSLVTCAQAFHWFEVAATRREFERILIPGGWCALVWNTAIVDGSDFAVGYERIKTEFGNDFQKTRHENLAALGRFDALFGAGNWEKRQFENFQTLGFEALKGRLLSSSYAPKAEHPRHESMIAALKDLFDRCERARVVQMNYATELFLGRLPGHP